MNSLSDIYRFLKSRGLIKKEVLEYELVLAGAKQEEKQAKHKKEFEGWKNSLPLKEREQFEEVFGEGVDK